jgi:hypothetical protein
MTDSGSTPRVTRWLRWFDTRADRLVGQKRLEGITLEELQALFSVDAKNPMYDCWKVEAAHVRRLEAAIGDRIDLDRFEYFVEADAMAS